MTSASELFYTRRSRVGRPDPDSGIGSSVERNYHRRNHLSHHNHRHDLEGGDPLRRSSHVRHFSSRAPSLSERSSVRFDEGTSELVSSNGLNADSVSNSRRQSLRSNERVARARFDEGASELVSSNGLNANGVSSSNRESLRSNERLPGDVLLARARLLERLRGVSVSANRRGSRAPPNTYRPENVSDDDFSIVDVGNWGSEISTGLSARRNSPITFETERFQLLQETNKKPPGLTQEARERLPLQIFRSREVDLERKTSRDCSICLESFGEEDVLTWLPCGHRFHLACLDPWVRKCGDCPYCRTSIL